jgi:hypothetical protein
MNGIRNLSAAQLETIRWTALRHGAIATANACLRELHRRWQSPQDKNVA